MNYSAILLAAGQSERFGVQNKLLMKIGNKTVIEKSLEIFMNDDQCEKIIIGISTTISEFIENKIKNSSKPIILVEGGVSRSHTVLNCIKKVKTSRHLIIHDGARPFITQKLIDRVLKPLNRYEGVIPGIPITDTVKKFNSANTVSQTINRQNLALIQTPQAFQFEKIEEAYFKWSDNDVHNIYDDSQILENYGHNSYVKIVEGERFNIKITFNSDLKIDN